MGHSKKPSNTSKLGTSGISSTKPINTTQGRSVRANAKTANLYNLDHSQISEILDHNEISLTE